MHQREAWRVYYLLFENVLLYGGAKVGMFCDASNDFVCEVRELTTVSYYFRCGETGFVEAQTLGGEYRPRRKNCLREHETPPFR